MLHLKRFYRRIRSLLHHSSKTRLYAYAWSLLLVTVATLISVAELYIIGTRNVSLPFILAVMFSGSWFGLPPALAAAMAAFLSYNFFVIEPHFSFAVAPADLVALVSFFAAALVVGIMAGQLGDRSHLIVKQLERLTTLLAASRDLTAAATTTDVAQNLARHLQLGGDIDAAIWLRDDKGQSLLAMTDAIAQSKLDMLPPVLEGKSASFHTLPSAHGEVGLVAVWMDDEVAQNISKDWFEALLHLGAIALDRAHLAEDITEVRLVAEREGLRTALLSSLSHDFRTPIAAILASTSSLILYEKQFDEATRRELIETIQQQAERLSRYISNLLGMTRLESGAIDLQRTLIDPAEAMISALEHTRRTLIHHQIERRFNTTGIMISVDPVLIEQALVNILENAANHGPAGSIISVSAFLDGDDVVLSVTDEGLGLKPDDLPRIFDKFFRGRNDRPHNNGVGLGLAVVKGIVEAFDGNVHAESPAHDGKGARFVIRLPAHQAMETQE